MASKDWAELNEAELEDLITRPLGAAELAEYEEVLSSQAFQDMVRRYHINAAQSGIRTVVVGCFRQGVSVDVMVTALANVWLDCFAKLDSRLDAETEHSWRQMPQLLVQILLQQALDVMNDHRDELQTDYPPEFQEMYAEWLAAMPGAETAADAANPSLEQAGPGEQVLRMYQVLNDFRLKLEAAGLQIDGNDYLEIWSLILLQTYLFGQEGQGELYFLLYTNWHFFLDRLSEIITLMLLLRGSETLLLPENRTRLTELMSDEGLI